MGLDPSVDASAFVQDVKEGELRHSENLWPDKKDWQGADDFASCDIKLCVWMLTAIHLETS